MAWRTFSLMLAITTTTHLQNFFLFQTENSDPLNNSSCPHPTPGHCHSTPWLYESDTVGDCTPVDLHCVCPFVTGSCQSARPPQGSSTVHPVSELPSLSKRSKYSTVFPCVCKTCCLSIHPSMDIWFAPTFKLLYERLLCICYFYNRKLSVTPGWCG